MTASTLEKIAALGLRTGPPLSLTLWIVAVDPPIKFSYFGRTVGLAIDAPRGHRTTESLRLDDVNDGSGGAILECLMMLIPLLAPGSTLHVFTLETSVSDAYEKGWLTKWVREGIEKRPRWNQLIKVRDQANVRLNASRPPKSSSDYTYLQELASETRPFREPKKRQWKPDARTENDRLRERAMEKDKDP